ncbi:MAG: hypothetical protein ACYSU7_15880, partial [Planctomycetota bacterium]
MKRRRFAITLTAVAVLGPAAWLLIHGALSRFTGAGTTLVEQWCGRQLAAIANDHLGPTMSFDRLGYAYPRTVTLSAVRFTSGDVPFITADAVGIEFAEIPV